MKQSMRIVIALLGVVLLSAACENRPFGTDAGYVLGPDAGYSSTDDPRVVLIHFSTGPSDHVLGAKIVREDEWSVTVRVQVRPAKSQRMVAVPRQVEVTLRETLGARQVMTDSGMALREMAIS